MDRNNLWTMRSLVVSIFVLIIIYMITSVFRSCGSDDRDTSSADSTTSVIDTLVPQNIDPDTVFIVKVDSSQYPDYVYSYEYIKIYEHFRPLISAIAHTESRGIPNMISKSGKYVGLLQQSKINVDDCNEVTGGAFTYDDRLNPKRSVMMFLITQKRYNKKMTYEMACRIWSRGDTSGTDPLAGEYWKKVKQEIGERDYSYLWE